MKAFWWVVREIYSLRETLTKNFEVNSTNVTESNERTNTRTNERTNIRTDKRQGENYIPRGINAGGIKIKDNECRAHDLGSYAQGQGHKRLKSCLGKNYWNKFNETSQKIEHNGKVCRAQGQGHNHDKGQIVPKIVFLINYWSKFDETSQKDKGYWEGVWCRQLRFLRLRSRSQSCQRSNSCLGNNSKTI